MAQQKIGRYHIRAELGRGGMATVYHAFDPEFEREVALKMLPREFLHDPDFRARFKREARIIASLEHAAIVPVYDYGEDDGQPFIVMRLMAGGSLADRLLKDPLTLPEASRLFTRIAAALDDAHSRGVIHRDLKPGNILFDRQGEPYISDFGIAKLSESSGSFTGSGRFIGTPAYMSPEQARGERSLDGRSDIYALGAILYEMLTGKMPYDADTPMGIALKHITDPVPRIRDVKPDLPAGCEEVISRAMAKERSGRYATASEMAQALSETVSGLRPATGKYTPEAASAPPARRRPVWAWAVMGLVVAGCAGAAMLASSGILLTFLAPTPATPIERVLVLSPTRVSELTTRTLNTPAPATPPFSLTPSATAEPLPRVLEFRACPETCLPDGSNAVETFPEKTARVYLHWRYENFPIGAAYTRTWSSRNELWVKYECAWPGPPSGEENISLREPEGLRGGYWEVTITVNEIVVLSESVFVEGAWELWTPPGTIGRCA
jgi:eukaryotic-like serine/threonine-protein kinase